jgi:DNA-binding NarL/FixJ family response regulator
MLKVLICDDSAEMRALMRETLAGSSELVVVGEAEDGTEALAGALTLAPDVVLMDVSMPVLDGVGATRCLGVVAPQVRVIGVTSSCDEATVAEMRSAGAVACYPKGVSRRDLERAAARLEPPARLAS